MVQAENGSFNNKPFLLVDTPGIFDPVKSDVEITNELRKVIDYLDPGPHCFFIVLRCKRFTKEDELSIRALRDLFGEKIFNHSIIVFTGIDDLEYDHISLDSFIQNSQNQNSEIMNVLKRCNGRYVGFNNRVDLGSSQNESQVRKLFEMVEDLAGSNLANFYSEKLFQHTSQNTQRQFEQIEMNPNLNPAQKQSQIEEIEKKVKSFFSLITTVIAGIRILITAKDQLCNIL